MRKSAKVLCMSSQAVPFGTMQIGYLQLYLPWVYQVKKAVHHMHDMAVFPVPC